MRVLIVSLLFPPVVSGGYEIECQQVADKLASYGHEVAILTSDYLCKGVIETVPYPVMRSLKMLMPLDQSVKSAMRWRKMKTLRFNQARTHEALTSFQPDIVYLWSLLRIGMGPARAADEAKIPYAWRIGDEFLSGYIPPHFNLWPRGLYRYLCDAWLFQSNTFAGLDFRSVSSITRSVANRLIQKGVPLQHAQVIPKGLPLEQFPPKPVLGGISKPVRILFIGRLHPEKGVHTLLQALKSAQSAMQVTVVGTGSESYMSELRQLAAQRPVTFLGHVSHSDLGPIYRDHDIFVFPSIVSEGFGATLQEAMASGLAIVSTAHGGQGEFLIDQENALVFPADDVGALKQQLDRLIQDPELRQHIAKGARKTAETYFSMESYGKSTEAFLSERLRSLKTRLHEGVSSDTSR